MFSIINKLGEVAEGVVLWVWFNKISGGWGGRG